MQQHAEMDPPAEHGRADELTVLHGKFAAYLSWSQPFIHNLVTGLGEHSKSVVICNRTENDHLFPVDEIVRIPTRYLVRPSSALLAAAYVHRHWNPDVLHAHFGWSGLRMLLLKQFLGVPLVTTFGGKDVGSQMHMQYFDRLYDILLEASDQLICVSEDLKTQLVNRGVDENRIEVIRRGTNLREFRFIDRSDRPADQPIRLLMVGRLVEKKGHRYAFEAIAELLRAGHDVRLTIAGEGEAYRALKQLRNRLGLSRHVEFLGVVDHETVRRHMEASDIFLHCSVTTEEGDCEGIPNVIVEAAATGLPVIGTEHGGIVETIKHGETGLLVAERDVAGLTAAIERLASDRSARLNMGRAAAEFMRAEFDLDRQIAQHLSIYRGLVEKYRRDSAAGRMFIPDEYADIVANTLHPRASRKDFSLAELAEWMLGPRWLDDRMVRYEPTMIEKLYAMKRYVPQPIKFPVKMALGNMMVAVIKQVQKRRYGDPQERMEQVDEKVLDFFRQGGDLTGIQENWSIEELAEHLPQHDETSQHATDNGSGAPPADRDDVPEIHTEPPRRDDSAVSSHQR